MANTLIISYDLNSPGQSYDPVINEIKSLGNWAKVQKSLWYVSSAYTARQAVDKVWAKMDRNDSLIVIDVQNKAAAWEGLNGEVAKHIQQTWLK